MQIGAKTRYAARTRWMKPAMARDKSSDRPARLCAVLSTSEAEALLSVAVFATSDAKQATLP